MSEITTPKRAPGLPGAAAVSRLGAAVSRTDFWIFLALLLLALGGAALSEVEDYGGHYYWSFLVIVFGAVSIARTWQDGQGQEVPIWPLIRTQVLHWMGALVAIQIVLLFEAAGITDRGPAADYTLLVLALSTFLAGVHFNWTFLLLGCILAATAISVGFLDQISIFLVTVPLALLAIWIVFRRRFRPQTGIK